MKTSASMVLVLGTLAAGSLWAGEEAPPVPPPKPASLAEPAAQATKVPAAVTEEAPPAPPPNLAPPVKPASRPKPAVQATKAQAPAAVTKVAVYIEVSGHPQGPLDEEALADRVAAGQVTPETLVWMPGMQTWKAAREVPLVDRLLTEVNSKPGTAAVPPPLPGSQPPAKTYYLGVQGRQEGPFTRQQVLEKLKTGALPPGTLVWHEGLKGWRPLAGLPEFAGQAPHKGLPGDVAGLKRFLQGTWRQEDNEGTVHVEIEMTFNADGTYTYRDKEQTSGMAPETTQYMGYWEVRPLSGSRFELILKDNPAAALADSMVSPLKYVDHDHLRDEFGELMTRVGP